MYQLRLLLAERNEYLVDDPKQLIFQVDTPIQSVNLGVFLGERFQVG